MIKKKNQVIKVFVDLDKTLLPFDTFIPTWKLILKSGRTPFFRTLVPGNGFKSLPKQLQASCFRGDSMETYFFVFSKMADHYIDKIDLEVKSWAERLSKDKANIHIVTGSLTALADGFSRRLNWGKSIGTEVEIRNGVINGRLKGQIIKGHQKLFAVRKIFSLKDEDFKACAATGDSYEDRYLMEMCSLRYFPKKSSNRLVRYFNLK